MCRVLETFRPLRRAIPLPEVSIHQQPSLNQPRKPLPPATSEKHVTAIFQLPLYVTSRESLAGDSQQQAISIVMLVMGQALFVTPLDVA
jgi:hypothetical protein